MNAELSISAQDGSIRISSVAQAISRGIRRDVIASEMEAFARGNIDHRNGYEWLMFHKLAFESQPCGLSLCFYEGSLQEVHLGVQLANASSKASWPTREAIDAEVSFMRQAFAKIFSRKFLTGEERFTWGVVWSAFDAKGFLASSGIRYAA